ncbi:hypothetical protein CIPAW_12G054800 [Carya illinoinensis]|uniref:Uncharacterized protein n=1 Tax=Carya illinoinensis TaxID=32201 RepID=A0A8T1NNC0_CARIL|nr:hypothetical protein CIPAW_12G054800 [Carya illinoinensis]
MSNIRYYRATCFVNLFKNWTSQFEKLRNPNIMCYKFFLSKVMCPSNKNNLCKRNLKVRENVLSADAICNSLCICKGAPEILPLCMVKAADIPGYRLILNTTDTVFLLGCIFLKQGVGC